DHAGTRHASFGAAAIPDLINLQHPPTQSGINEVILTSPLGKGLNYANLRVPAPDARAPVPVQLVSTFAAFTTSAQRFISASMKAPNSSGVWGSTTLQPIFSICATTSGLRTASVTAALISSMT